MTRQWQAEHYFKKRFRKKTLELQIAIEDTILKLAEDTTTPGLRVHRIWSAEGEVWSASVDMVNRITFHYEGEMIVLRNHCHHDRAYRRP